MIRSGNLRIQTVICIRYLDAFDLGKTEAEASAFVPKRLTHYELFAAIEIGLPQPVFGRIFRFVGT